MHVVFDDSNRPATQIILDPLDVSFSSPFIIDGFIGCQATHPKNELVQRLAAMLLPDFEKDPIGPQCRALQWLRFGQNFAS